MNFDKSRHHFWFLIHAKKTWCEQTLSDNHVGMFLLWSRLIIMLVSATYFFYGAYLNCQSCWFFSMTYFFYGADAIWWSCWFLWHISPTEHTLSDNRVGFCDMIRWFLWHDSSMEQDSIWQSCWFVCLFFLLWSILTIRWFLYMLFLRSILFLVIMLVLFDMFLL